MEDMCSKSLRSLARFRWLFTKKNIYISIYKLVVRSGCTNRPAEILGAIKNRYNFRSGPSLGAEAQI